MTEYLWLLLPVVGIVVYMVIDILRNTEYKPGEPSHKCPHCRFTVYDSSLQEHIKIAHPEV